MTDQIADSSDYLDQKATSSEFARLVGVSQQAISKQVISGIFENCTTLREWLFAYCEHLREQAAGRGGALQETLAAARAEEAKIKSAIYRLDYLKRLGQLIQIEDVVQILQRWAAFANRENKACIDKIVSEIQAAHSISCDTTLVNSFVESSANRVADYAQKLGESLVTDSGDISTKGIGPDS